MTMLCFLLDLCSISPPLLRELKQCLMQLANLYAVSSGGRGEGAESMHLLSDRIGLCYINRTKASPPELKIAYRPGEKFNLRDFHHAVDNLPTNNFLLESSETMPPESGNQASLANLLSLESLYGWGGEDVLKKVIVIGTSMFTNSESLQQSLMDAAERCVTVEFIVLEQPEADLYSDVPEKVNHFINSISDLENCVLRRYPPDTWILCRLVKSWLQELKNETKDNVQAVFLFKNTILGSADRILCNLFASSNPVTDGFTLCQACRCHGYPIGNTINKKAKRSCPVTCMGIEAFDIFENAVMVGKHNLLFLPSFDGLTQLKKVSGPITFNVIERTDLTLLNEGVIVGTSYFVTPSACQDIQATSEEHDKSELNIQLFHGLCGGLFKSDQGFICSSTCNTETMMEGLFQCFYVLQPSERGPMLLRKLVGSEEILPIPDIIRSNDAIVSDSIENSIKKFLSEIELGEYNPLQHERGFHQKLNWLVKESLQFGSIAPCGDASPKLQNLTHCQASIPGMASTTQCPEEEMTLGHDKTEGNTSSCMSEEWEQLLIIDEMNDSFSPTFMSKPSIQTSALASKPLDVKTSKILERLEPPKQQKQKEASPSILPRMICGQTKKPLLPFDSSSSQPLKPKFQRLKRRQI